MSKYNVGDYVIVTKDHPFSAPLLAGDRVKVNKVREAEAEVKSRLTVSGKPTNRDNDYTDAYEWGVAFEHVKPETYAVGDLVEVTEDSPFTANLKVGDIVEVFAPESTDYNKDRIRVGDPFNRDNNHTSDYKWYVSPTQHVKPYTGPDPRVKEEPVKPTPQSRVGQYVVLDGDTVHKVEFVTDPCIYGNPSPDYHLDNGTLAHESRLTFLVREDGTPHVTPETTVFEVRHTYVGKYSGSRYTVSSVDEDGDAVAKGEDSSYKLILLAHDRKSYMEDTA